MFSNFHSNQEISFKLTQNQLPSFNNSKDILIPYQNSLQYTFSRVSIQKILEDDPIQIPSLENCGESGFEKNSSLKASSIKTAADSPIKITPRGSFRERILTYKICDTNQNSNIYQKSARKSQSKYLIFQNQKRKKFWSGDNKQIKRLKSKENNNNNQLKPKHLQKNHHHQKVIDETSITLGLKNSLLVTQIQLKNNQNKQKRYMKSILQNRINCQANKMTIKIFPI